VSRGSEIVISLEHGDTATAGRLCRGYNAAWLVDSYKEEIKCQSLTQPL
jgi:hypothetical protein